MSRRSAEPRTSPSGWTTIWWVSAVTSEALPVVIADTSALIAFFNDADQHHKAVRAGFARVGHLVVSPCVLTELDYLLATRQAPSAAKAALGYIAGRAAAGRWE